MRNVAQQTKYIVIIVRLTRSLADSNKYPRFRNMKYLTRSYKMIKTPHPPHYLFCNNSNLKQN